MSQRARDDAPLQYEARREILRDGWSMRQTMSVGMLAAWTGAAQRVVHDLANAAHTPSTLGAATEAAIDLSGRARRLCRDGVADLIGGQNIARADDHGTGIMGGGDSDWDGSLVRYCKRAEIAKKNRTLC